MTDEQRKAEFERVRADVGIFCARAHEGVTAEQGIAWWDAMLAHIEALAGEHGLTVNGVELFPYKGEHGEIGLDLKNAEGFRFPAWMPVMADTERATKFFRWAMPQMSAREDKPK